MKTLSHISIDPIYCCRPPPNMTKHIFQNIMRMEGNTSGNNNIIVDL